MNTVSSVWELVRNRAATNPTKRAYTFLEDGERELRRLTWADVDLRAKAIGRWLQSVGANGHRAILLFQPGLEFVEAFFGCLYGGVTAVPAYPLNPDRLERTVSRLRTMMADAIPGFVLTDQTSLYLAVQMRCHELNVRWMLTSGIADSHAEQWTPPRAQTEDVVLIQYTSGSVSAPKGVMITNRNILANERTIQEAHDYDETSTLVGWVPLAHDWGLINSVIQPACSGAQSVLMAPEAFLQKPVRWLRTISRYLNVASGGPNFAYDLCMHKIRPEECRDVNLSEWKCAGVSAGPVRAETLERFADRFGPYGFDQNSFYSGYGLAEATLLVCDTERGRFPTVLDVSTRMLQEHRVAVEAGYGEQATRLVSCGCPPATTRVAVIEPRTLEHCQSGSVGEICLTGENIALGYWNKPAQTDAGLRFLLPGTYEGPFLRTGDLGFMHENELFITGRLNDLIIIRGRNIHPHDVETSVERCHHSLRPGCAIAFSIHAAEDDRLVIVQEVRDTDSANFDEAIHAIRRVVMADHDIVPHAVVLVGPGVIPKTSSGKLRRATCAGAYVSGTLPLARAHVLQRVTTTETS